LLAGGDSGAPTHGQSASSLGTPAAQVWKRKENSLRWGIGHHLDLEDQMNCWVRSLLLVSFIGAGCGGSSADIDSDPTASIASAAVKCRQSQTYDSVTLERIVCSWYGPGELGPYECKDPHPVTVQATVICENECDRATLECTWTDANNATYIVPKPNAEPTYVDWYACNSANVCGSTTPNPPRTTLAGGTLTGGGSL
jgi:hypothetical protein